MDDKFPDGLLDDITEFFSTEHTRQPGLDLYPEVFSRPLFFPLQRPAELRQMMRMARTCGTVKTRGCSSDVGVSEESSGILEKSSGLSSGPKVVMEIGADKGGGLYHWCKCLPSITHVIACEIRGCPYKYMFERTFPNIKFLWLDGSSYDQHTVGLVVAWILAPCARQIGRGLEGIDCLFLDGDKARFSDDFRAYFRLVKQGGYVFIHDIDEGNPRETFIEVTKRGEMLGVECSTIVDKSDTDLVLGREKIGIPPTTPHEAWLRHWKGRSCGVGVVRKIK